MSACAISFASAFGEAALPDFSEPLMTYRANTRYEEIFSNSERKSFITSFQRSP
ncbi:hypothetical protein EVA_04909 [gut metagenome]|uniref:Uncharacterized protein n=1 Tax=gut metagenome TaxID=749906 RepID=J9GVP0_9ZZZZ